MTLRVDWYLYQASTINIKGARAILVKSLTYQALTRNTTIRLITLWAETVQYDLLRYEHRRVIEHWLLKFWDLILPQFFILTLKFSLWNFAIYWALTVEILRSDFTTILHFDFEIFTLEFCNLTLTCILILEFCVSLCSWIWKSSVQFGFITQPTESL